MPGRKYKRKCPTCGARLVKFPDADLEGRNSYMCTGTPVSHTFVIRKGRYIRMEDV